MESEIKALSPLVQQALLADRMAAQKEIRRIRHLLGKGATPEKIRGRLDRLTHRLETSRALLQQRQQSLPDLNIDGRLPIAQKKDELVAAIKKHRVLIVAGETGSGKTTQIPKFCLLAGRGIHGTIGVTQPRRIAAITVSRRIAEEINDPCDAMVGYKIRFKDTSRARPRIKIMTDGILLSEAHRDPFLNFYDTLVVDEAHERSLNIDFILGILKKLIRKRPDLKLIITSATIDTAKFSAAFDHAPVIEVSGRLYPVDVRWEPAVDTGDENGSYVEQAVQAVDRLEREKRRGDILIFMPTERDIHETCELLEGRHLPNTQILPLFARLTADDQHRVFQSFGGRKIVVATNVAETSITIPGIQYVIDTGLARISQYVPRSRTTTLPVVPVSQSSADQRMGRCGRVAKGICIRLFSEEDYLNRPRFTPPEVLRSSLADVILRMAALKLGAAADFPFIDPPAPKNIQDGIQLLTELGAIQKSTHARTGSQAHRLTAKGRLMARLPLDPRLACILLEAHTRGCLNDVIIIAAALSIQDVRERPLDQQQAADKAHAVFADPLSDFITLLRIWHAYDQSVTRRTSWRQVKHFCRTHFLSFPRLREWRDIHQQLNQILAEHGIKSDSKEHAPDAPGDLQDSWYVDFHTAILSGFLSNIAIKQENKTFLAAHHRQVMIFPGSGLFDHPGNWIVAAEMVETSRPFARCAAVIAPGWIEPLAADQCTYAYLDPHWEKNRGAVMVTEQVSLYGLIVERRLKPYGPVNPEEATEIFIRQALMEGEVRQPPGFINHNRRKTAEIEEMEHRLRRRDLLVDEYQLLAFYQERLGTVSDLRTLKRIIRRSGGDGFLRMQDEDLLNRMPDRAELKDFPKQLSLGDQRLKYRYTFDPGNDADGVTVVVPMTAAGAVNAETFQWLVPGLLKEKIAALIKALPKTWRKQLVPITETADRIAREMPPQRDIGLSQALSDFIERNLSLRIPLTAWDESLLPDHLRMRITIVDGSGKTVQTSRDAAILKQSADQRPADDFKQALKGYERFPIESWDFGDLADHVILSAPGGSRWRAYPALTVRDGGLALSAMTDPGAARNAHRQGVRALLTRHFSQDAKYLRKNLRLPDHCEAAARCFGGRRFLEQQLFQRVLTDLWDEEIRTERAFRETVSAIAKNGLAGEGQSTRQGLIEFLAVYQETRMVLANLENDHAGRQAILEFLAGLRRQLENLVPDHFLTLYDQAQLRQIGRYVKAVAIRAERGVVDPDKDQRKADQVAPYEQRLAQMVQSLGTDTGNAKQMAVEDFFWMLEEFKISIFAQEIKTARPVSAKRLNKQLKAIEEMP